VDQTAGEILAAAAEDGRFDVMLLIYNFLNHDEGDGVLAACKANNVGTTAMKTAAGALSWQPLDPDHLTEAQQRSLDRFIQRGQSREAALERLRAQAQRQRELYDRTRPFADRFGIQTQEQLRVGSIHWVLQNPDMHTACIAFTEFGLIDRVVPISGTPMTEGEGAMLRQIELALDRQYCRHGCIECLGSCPVGVPVSTIMRYAYYYEGQGMEKHAMALYAGLEGPGASACLDCDGHCADACPHGIDIQTTLHQVHGLLTLP
jgi:predicted aldo/keto reductase-like oxidoreductase